MSEDCCWYLLFEFIIVILSSAIIFSLSSGSWRHGALWSDGPEDREDSGDHQGGRELLLLLLLPQLCCLGAIVCVLALSYLLLMPGVGVYILIGG